MVNYIKDLLSNNEKLHRLSNDWYSNQFEGLGGRQRIIGLTENGSKEYIIDCWITPLIKVLFLYIVTKDDIFKNIYLGERFNRPFKIDAGIDGKRGYFSQVVVQDIQSILNLFEDPDFEAEKILSDIHSCLTAFDESIPVSITMIGDCLMTQIGVSLAGFSLSNKKPINIREYYIGAWGYSHDFDSYTENLCYKTSGLNIVTISFFTYWGIPAFRNLIISLWENKISYSAAEESFNALVNYISGYVDSALRESNAIVFLHNASGLPWLLERDLSYSPWNFKRGGDRIGVEEYIGKINIKIDCLVKSKKRVFLIDERDVVSRYGLDFCYEDILSSYSFYKSESHPIFHFNRMGLFLAEKYREIVNLLALVNDKKIIFVDFDNTLWSGVMAEEEVVHYVEKQELIRSLSESGVMLVAVSKNDLKNIRWSQMRVQRSDFSLLKINWHSKATNILRAAKELNISLQNSIFIDDSEQELALVASRIPQVLCLNTKSSETWRALECLLRLQSASTEESRKRNYLYQANAERKKYVNSQESVDSDDLHKLFEPMEILAGASEASLSEINRVFELLSRTNQFNCSGKIYTKAELIEFISRKNWAIKTYTMSDKFGNMGLIGAAIIEVNPATRGGVIHNFVMSCRAMGYGMEHYMLSNILSCFDIDEWIGIFHPTSNNSPAQEFYISAGFRSMGNGQWKINKYESRMACPSWIGSIKSSQ